MLDLPRREMDALLIQPSHLVIRGRTRASDSYATTKWDKTKGNMRLLLSGGENMLMDITIVVVCTDLLSKELHR